MLKNAPQLSFSMVTHGFLAVAAAAASFQQVNFLSVILLSAFVIHTYAST